MPTPPVTCRAPVPVLVESVLFVSVVTPLAVNVVNAPVAAVLAPMGKLSAYPPVIRALPVLKFVACAVVAVRLANPLTYPPVMTTLPLAKLVAVAVVAAKLVTLAVVIVALVSADI